MAFTTVPHIVPPTELQAPTGPGAAEIASGDQIVAAIKALDINALDFRQHSVLASAIAIIRGAKMRARALPVEAMVGNEMSRVLTAIQSSPEGTIESLVAALIATSEQWESLSQPVRIPRTQPEA